MVFFLSSPMAKGGEGGGGLDAIPNQVCQVFLDNGKSF